EGYDAVANFGTDRPAAAGDDDRFVAHKGFETTVIDSHLRPQQQIFDVHRRKPQRLAAVVERGKPAGDQSQAPGPHQDRFGVGVRTSRVTSVPPLLSSATTGSMSSGPPSTEMPRMAWPRSAKDGDRMPTGRIFFTAPLSIARSSTSASAVRPTTRIGIESPALACRSVRV